MKAQTLNNMLAHQAPRRLRRRRHRVKLTVCLVILGVLGVLSFTPARYVALNAASGVGDTFMTYRLMSERDELRATNEQLKEELAGLKARVALESSSGFEASVRAKLDELQAVISAATELDVSEGNLTIAGKGKKGAKQAVATLKAPKANKPKANKRLAVGGKEVECDRGGDCDRLVRKQNVALEIGPSFFIPKLGNLVEQSPRTEEVDGLSPTHRDLQRRLDSLTAGLRALPIGYPAHGEVTSHYGFRLSPFSRRASFHEGMDISLDRGDDVLVTGDGVVESVGYDGAYGYVVDVEHSPGVLTRYAHLSKTLVRAGQKVERGDRIALSGNSGRSTGPHLHYEVRVNGRARNPKAFVMLAQKLATIL